MDFMFSVLRIMAFAIALAFQSLSLAGNLRSPLNENAEVEIYAETAVDRWLLELDLEKLKTTKDLDDVAFTLHRINKSNPSQVATYRVSSEQRQLYLDGGTRIIEFQLGSDKAALYLPYKPGSSSIGGYGTQPILRTPSGDSPLVRYWANAVQDDSAGARMMMDLFDQSSRKAFKGSGTIPSISTEQVEHRLKRKGRFGVCYRLLDQLVSWKKR